MLVPILDWIIRNFSELTAYVISVIVIFIFYYVLFKIQGGSLENIRNLSKGKKIKLIIFLICGLFIAYIFFKLIYSNIFDTNLPIFLTKPTELVINFLEKINILK